MWRRVPSHVCLPCSTTTSFFDLMVDSPILQTCWVCFLVDDKNRTQKEFIKEDREGTKWEKSMCRRNSNCLTLFMESGATYYVPLPFLVIHTHFNIKKVYTCTSDFDPLPYTNVLYSFILPSMYIYSYTHW